MSGMTLPSHNPAFLLQTTSLLADLLTDLLADITALDAAAARERVWNARVARICDDVSRFVEASTLLARLVGARTPAALPAARDAHLRLLFVMKAVTQAQLARDRGALEELIKYELKDNLTRWKIELIPHLKKTLPT